MFILMSNNVITFRFWKSTFQSFGYDGSSQNLTKLELTTRFTLVRQ